MNNSNIESEIDTYDIFNVEYSDNILDTYYKIIEYCDPMYINIHNNPNFSDFFNIIYNNTDIYNSSKIIKKIKKSDNEDSLQSDFDENYINDNYEY
jgi:hypothetical protein|tara:strand:- start:1671 stop:1958 length:288 start_codon:yes stop_codon:yes gene_type:complete